LSVDGIRPEVYAFADAMERELRQNDHKGGWTECTDQYLIDKLMEEVVELIDATVGIDADNIWDVLKQFGNHLFNEAGSAGNKISEAADVANIALMIADPERKAAPTEPERGTR
jgi:hypothetical protein